MHHRNSFELGRVFASRIAARSLTRLVRQRRTIHQLCLVTLVVAFLSTTGCTKKVSVPSVVQMDLEQARNLLAAVPLKTGMVSSAQGAVIPGAYVVSQTPNAGEQVPMNTPINLTVELPISVPNLVDSSLADAVNTLQTVGLKVMLMKQPTMNIFGKTKVVQQNPQANSMVRHDTAVMLTVTAPPDLGAVLGAVSKDPAYQKLNPEYRDILTTFLK